MRVLSFLLLLTGASAFGMLCGIDAVEKTLRSLVSARILDLSPPVVFQKPGVPSQFTPGV